MRRLVCAFVVLFYFYFNAAQGISASRASHTPNLAVEAIVLVPVTAVAYIANFLVDGVAPSSSSFASSQVERISLGKRVCNLFSHLPNNEAIPK